MNPSNIRTYSMMDKRFCWDGVGIRPTATAERSMKAHRHSFFQIFFVAQGCAVHEINGDAVEATAGHIFFVKPYTVHRALVPADSECYFIYFDGRFLQRTFGVTESMPEDKALLNAPELAPFAYQSACCYKLDGATTTRLRDRCLRIAAACQRRDLYDHAEIRAELTLLLTTVAKVYVAEFGKKESDVGSEALQNRHVRSTLRYIRENFHRPVTLTEVAEKVHLSETYLTHLLKHKTGKTFKPLLEEFRFENAKNLLAYTDLSLTTIASSSGFPDPRHFARRFKLYTNTTPVRFRKERTSMA